MRVGERKEGRNRERGKEAGSEGGREGLAFFTLTSLLRPNFSSEKDEVTWVILTPILISPCVGSHICKT